ncbi:MAG: hypothetical protein AB8D78_03915 [Akkermansiaceae bacterium]
MKSFRILLIALFFSSLCPNLFGEDLDWVSYPVSDEISYGGMVVQVRPRQYVKLKAPLSGDLHLKVKNGTYEKGTIWAEFEPETVALEMELIELTKSLHELKEKPMAKLEMVDGRAGLENRRDELKRNLAMMEEILADPDLAEFYLGEKKGNQATSRSTIMEMKARLVAQITALDEAMQFIGTPDQERSELRLAELQLKRKENEIKKKAQESKLKLPFTGDLRYLSELPDDPEAPLVMQSGDEIAEIVDYTTLQCDMVVNRTSLRQLPTSALYLDFQQGNGRSLRARFKTKKTVEIFGKPELVYVFEFPSEQASAARPLVGGRVSADLVVKLATEATLVPKLDLVRSKPESFRDRGWRMGVENGFSGRRVLAVGQSDVAIVSVPPKDE